MRVYSIKLTVFVVLVAVSCGFFCLSESSWAEKKESLTNPLLDVMDFKELRPFRSKMTAMIEQEKSKGRITEVAVYFRSLADGIWTGINERVEFCPASLLKIPLMLTYFRMAEYNPEVLNQKLRYEARPAEGYVRRIVKKNSAKEGEYYSVDDLIRLMIAESDNNAAEILLTNLAPGMLEKTFYDFGIDPNQLQGDKGFVSLKIVASFLRSLYNASYANKTLSEKGLRYLTQCDFHDGLVSGLPKNITIAHKFGERFFPETNQKELHEAGIIYYPNNPYILAIMTKGTDYQEMSKTIKNISELVYREIDSQYHEKEKNYSIDVE